MDGSLSWGLLFALLLPGPAAADKVNSEWLSTARALSMGNVGIASADDPSTAAFYNPAALAKNKKTIVEVLNPQFEVGAGLMALNKDFFSFGKHGSLESLKPVLKEGAGKISSLGFSIFPNVSTQNFNFGILYSVKSHSYYDKDSDSFHHGNRRLLVPSFALAIPLMGGRIRLGLAARGVQIFDRDAHLKGSDTSKISPKDDARQGFGVALDTGIMVTMPMALMPTLGFVARNLGDVAYGGSLLLPVGPGTDRKHEASKMALDGGLALNPRMGGKRDRFVLALDYRDILNASGAAFMRHYNLGMEFSLSGIVFLRAGYGMGYWSAGLGLQGKTGGLEIGSYGQELSETGYNQVEDRRFILKLLRKF